MKISEDKKFKDITTFHIGGKIKYYIEVEDEKGVFEAVHFAKKNSLPVFMVGEGSDLLADDKTYNGVVIKYLGDDLAFEEEGFKVLVTAGAGLKWDNLVKEAVERDLQGIECLSGIPGTVGGAPVQNVGAYGQEISDTFHNLKAYDIEKGKYKIFTKDECEFGYRDSVFKNNKFWQKYLIIQVSLMLSRNKKTKANYESLRGVVGENAELQEIRNAILKIRSEKLENPKLVGNAGSFFKNPIVDTQKKEDLEKKFPGIKIYPYSDKFKTSAAWLIEKAGWKGKCYGDAAVSSKHSLFLINKTGSAPASDIYKLAEMIESDIFKKFGIKLEKEVQLINK
jgi:UDP-N-acetylmuramate dehydrogenase